MEVGRRLIYNKSTGEVILDMGEMNGNVYQRDIWGELAYIDLEYGKFTDEFRRLKEGIKSVRVINEDLQFDLAETLETEEERLRREKEELENQLLLKEDEIIGGIL